MSALHFATDLSDKPRAGGGALTDRVAKRIAEMWPEVDRPLRSSLATRGLPRAEVDDTVQETALRALESGIFFEDSEHMRRWCFVVARRLVVDAHRRNRRIAPLDEAAAAACADAVRSLNQVEDRDVLRRVAVALPHMREADRAALRQDSALNADASAAERNRANVARHRARRRLRLLVGPFAAAAGACLGALRRPGSAATAVALPALVALSFSAADGFAFEASDRRVQLAVTQPQAGQPLALRLRADRAAASSDTAPGAGRAHDAAATPARAARTESEAALIVAAPAGTHVGVRRSAAQPGDALLCLEGDLIDLCLNPPSPAAPAADPPAAGPGPEPTTANTDLLEVPR